VFFSRLPIGNPVAALGGSGRRESQWLKLSISEWRLPIANQRGAHAPRIGNRKSKIGNLA
jgi:hypothetical protein